MVLFMKLFPKQKFSNYISSGHTTSANTVYNHFTDKTIEMNNTLLDSKEL